MDEFALTVWQGIASIVSEQVQSRGCVVCAALKPTSGISPMKTSLRVLSLVLALGAASTVAQAQGGGGGGGGRGGMSMEERKTRMFEGITLTVDQKTKVDTIMAESAKKQQELRSSMGPDGDRQAMMGKMREIQTEQSKAIKAVLTADQQPVFDKNMEGMMPRRPGN